MLVTARGGAGGGAMTFLVRVGDEHGGFTGLTVARLRANAPVLVRDEQSGCGEGSDVQDQGAGGGRGSQVSGALALVAVFAWVCSPLGAGALRLAVFESDASFSICSHT